MVRSDLGSSGVAFSLDTESGFKDVIVINGSYGLGEMVVQGSVSPDEFIVFKPTLEKGYKSIIEKKLGVKDQKMVYGDDPDERVRIIPTERTAQYRFCLSDENILKLAGWVAIIEQYYSRIKDHWCPMDVEWALDGLSQELFIVQARPETIHSRKQHNTITEYVMKNKPADAKPIVKGIAVGDKIGAGKVSIMFSLDKRVEEGHEFKEGDVLVTDMTDPDWEPIMKKHRPSSPTKVEEPATQPSWPARWECLPSLVVAMLPISSRKDRRSPSPAQKVMKALYTREKWTYEAIETSLTISRKRIRPLC